MLGAFAMYLFTHNARVGMLCAALGFAAGVPVMLLLFTNGLLLGAFAALYQDRGLGIEFWAWILPHGIPEITEIIIAGGAGLILARGLVKPGRLRRRDALVKEARLASKLIVGGMPILILAGLIEGTISQMHEPAMPYVAKLAFAIIVGAGVYAYLFFAGRRASPEDSEPVDA